MQHLQVSLLLMYINSIQLATQADQDLQASPGLMVLEPSELSA